MKRNKKINIDDLEKKQVFSVPEDYFENLPAAIQKRLSTPHTRTSSLYLHWIRYGVTITGLALFFVAGYLFYDTGTPLQKPAKLLSEVSNEDIINYLGQTDVAQYELIETAVTRNVSLEEEIFSDIEIPEELLLYEVASPTNQDNI